MANKLFPLTLPQSDIYLDQLRRGRSPAYNVGGYIRLGRIDAERLAEAHRRLIQEGEVFGIRISVINGDVFQGISDVRTTTLKIQDFSREERPLDAAAEWRTSLFENALDILDTELFRAFLVKIADDHYHYVGLAHHILMDGWGFSIWAERLCQLYDDPDLPAQTDLAWREIALEDQKYLASKKYEVDKRYWVDHVREVAPALFSPRYLNTFEDAAKVSSRRKTIAISRKEFDDVNSSAGRVGAGVAHHFVAMLAVYFCKSLRRDRPAFGLPFHGRRGHREKKMLGVFASISPMCIDMADGESTFGELVQNVFERQKGHFRHQRYPLGHIIRDVAHSDDRRSLYDISFNYLHLRGNLSIGGNKAGLVYVGSNHSATPLVVTLCDHGEMEPAQLHLDYNHAYINDEEVELLSSRLLFLLRSLCGNYGRRLTELEILPEDEKRRLLEGFGDPPLAVAPNECIHHLFEKQAKQTPNAIAVSAGGDSLTYDELNRRANHVAVELIRLGIKPESLVGLLMERTPDILAAVLGILKAGGAYLPLDPSYPLQRIHMMIEDSRVNLVLAHRRLAERIASIEVRITLIDDMLENMAVRQNGNSDPIVGLTPANLAYVIYTSGSTGRPKGVQICHYSTVAFLKWVKTVYTPEDLEKVLASTSLSFDLSVFEMLAPLVTGGQCVIVQDIFELLEKQVDVSLINTVPSAMRALIDQKALPLHVRVINLAGEPLPMNIVNDLLTSHKCDRVLNLYGPSEDTTYSTYAIFRHATTDKPDIGRAIAGTYLYILFDDGTLAPIGSVGELHIAGNGLARGYLNCPDLTAERFIAAPFAVCCGGRLYKTGDLVRYRSNGVLEYLGRNDDQVKVRGFRVELREIQRQIEQLDEVKAAVVIARDRGIAGKYLAAYVERKTKAAGPSPELSDRKWVDGLQRELRAVLPGYMVPSSLTVLDAIPLTPNGKIDKNALPEPDGSAIPLNEYVAPETETESKVAERWAAILGIDAHQVGAATSLFEFGGHSLLLARLANDLDTELDVRLSMRAVFAAKDIRDLAARVDAEIALRLVENRMNDAVIINEGYL